MNTIQRALAAAALLLGAAGPAASQSAVPPVDFFIGSWGVVAFNDERDVGRMTQVARGFCNIPYRIARRSAETFEMFVAESLREVRLMQQEGRVYIVPAQAEGNVLRGARELTMRGPDSFSLRFLENANHQRYGQNVFVRCGGRAAMR
jgi:hypothetical protein